MKYQKYDKYKDSEIEWLGYIPDSWTVRKIKWESPVYRGASPRPIEDPAYFDDEGEYAWVRISDVTASNTYLRETQQRLSDFGAGFSIKLQPGSLFLSIAGSVGKPCITAIKCCIHDGFVYFPKLKIENKFLYYIFASGEPYKGLGKMGTQLNLNTETVGSIQIPIPTPNEQNSIVEFLDRETTHIDTLIDKKQKLIELLKEKRTALITQAVTKGLNPDVKMKNSGIEWCDIFPEDWNVISLKWISKIYAGGTPDKSVETYWENGTIPWINSGAVNQKYITKYSDLITEDAYKSSSAKWIPKGSLVMALAGQGKTKGMVAYLEIDTTCNQSMAAIIPRKDIYSKYLMYWLEINYNNIRNLGGGNARDGINLEMIGTIKCPVPSLKEQKQIAEIIEKETERIEILKDKISIAIEKHKEYRTALISATVTGKIKVTQD
jgi:type I restriction enzyme S subunit